MPRTCYWKWLGVLALAASPHLALGQEATSQAHTVRPGDTLWDLAKLYRGDPFLWPDLYRLNTGVVEDPHWIYPGEVLQLSATKEVASVPVADTPLPGPSGESIAAAAVDSNAILVDSVADSVAVAEPVAAAEPVPSLAEPAPSLTDSSDGRASYAELASAPPADIQAPLFGPRRTDQLQEVLKAYTEQPYRALRKSEFYSSGFLTEQDRLPFGQVLGPVTPQQIRSMSTNSSALPYAAIAVEAPKGAVYQIGDSLLLLQLRQGAPPYGQMVIPTGLARITDTVSGRYIAIVAAVYGPIRNGQQVLPAERFTPSGSGHAVAVSQGVEAKLIGGPGRQDLKAPQMVLFLDKGRADGVAAGDLFEVRRTPERLPDGGQRVDELMATLQVVHVRDHTATVRLLNVISPDIAPGTRVRQVAKLPS